MKQNIVILGAGFAGLKCALRLDELLRVHRLRQSFQLILVDRNDFQTFVPMLYEVANTLADASSREYLREVIALPFSETLAESQIRFIQGEVVELDLPSHSVILKDASSIVFAYLVIALGSETHTFDIPGIAEHAYFLKTLDDALRLREALERVFQKNHGPLFRVLVGGAGLTGVEVAGELGGALRKLRKKYSRRVSKFEIVLIEGMQEILPGFSSYIVRKARARLAKLGVEIETGRSISSFDGQRVTFRDGGAAEVDLLIWTGGVKACAVLQGTRLPLAKRGDVEVSSILQVRGEGHIFAVGDAACLVNPQSGAATPWNIPIAEEEAFIAAQNILRAIQGLPSLTYHPPSHVPVVIPIGGKYAIADLGFIQVSGFLGWAIKHLVTLRYYLSILPWWLAISKWLRAMRVFVRND